MVYLKAATALELQQYCQSKTPQAAVFRLRLSRMSRMVQFDLSRTAVKDGNGKVIVPAIPYVENGLFFDFHSLRHQCASLLAMNPGASETVRQRALRHKTPQMTRHYSHVFEEQQRAAIDALPDLTQPSILAQVAVKTGTDDRAVTGEILSNSCFLRASGRNQTEQDGNENAVAMGEPPLCENNEGEQRSG